MITFSKGQESPCVVGEVGSYYTKMGFAGENFPRSYFRSTTAILRDTTSLDSHDIKNRIINRSYDFLNTPLIRDNNNDGNWEVANPINSTTGLLFPTISDESSSTQPASISSNENFYLSEGISTPHNTNYINGKGGDEDGECYSLFNSYLTHGYNTALKINPTSCPFLLIERSYNPPPIRQKCLEILFEYQNTPAVFLSRDAVCACYAVGRTTATVVDIGHLGTVTSPVYEGFVEGKGVLRSPVGGKMMDVRVLEVLDNLVKINHSKRLAQSVFGDDTDRARSSLLSSRCSGSSNYDIYGGNINKATEDLDYVTPFYQTKMKNKKRRKDVFHKLARLDVARQCREDGCGAGVAVFGYASLDKEDYCIYDNRKKGNMVYQNYANSSKTPYKLPDGTVVHIPLTECVGVAELLFGKDSSNIIRRENAVNVICKRARKILSDLENSNVNNIKSRTVNAINSFDYSLQKKQKIFNNFEQIVDYNKCNRSFGNEYRIKNKVKNISSSGAIVKSCLPFLTSYVERITTGTVHSSICEAALRCDKEQQRELLGNVVLCGGGACIESPSTPCGETSNATKKFDSGNTILNRIRAETEALLQLDTPGWRVKVISPGINERAICSWLGGSILGSLGSFNEMWITRHDYNEQGSSIVNRKCP